MNSFSVIANKNGVGATLHGISIGNNLTATTIIQIQGLLNKFTIYSIQHSTQP